MTENKCPITDKILSSKNLTPKIDGNFYEYDTKYGKIRIGVYAFKRLANMELSTENKTILKGYIYNRKVEGDNNYIISTEFIDNIEKLDYPDNFDRKWIHLLKYIKIKCGKNRIPINLSCHDDYPLTFSSPTLAQVLAQP